jgi:hypothetical protein
MTQHTSNTLKYVHIRARHNGVPSDNGGCCLAVIPRQDGRLTVGLAQCPPTRPYDERLGQAVAAARLRAGKALVLPNAEALQDLAGKLSQKRSTGMLVRVDLSHIIRKS